MSTTNPPQTSEETPIYSPRGRMRIPRDGRQIRSTSAFEPLARIPTPVPIPAINLMEPGRAGGSGSSSSGGGALSLPSISETMSADACSAPAPEGSVSTGAVAAMTGVPAVSDATLAAPAAVAAGGHGPYRVSRFTEANGGDGDFEEEGKGKGKEKEEGQTKKLAKENQVSCKGKGEEKEKGVEEKKNQSEGEKEDAKEVKEYQVPKFDRWGREYCTGDIAWSGKITNWGGGWRCETCIAELRNLSRWRKIMGAMTRPSLTPTTYRLQSVEQDEELRRTSSTMTWGAVLAPSNTVDDTSMSDRNSLPSPRSSPPCADCCPPGSADTKQGNRSRTSSVTLTPKQEVLFLKTVRREMYREQPTIADELLWKLDRDFEYCTSPQARQWKKIKVKCSRDGRGMGRVVQVVKEVLRRVKRG